MKHIKKYFALIIVAAFLLTTWKLYSAPNEKTAIQLFPINDKVTYTDVGSSLEVYEKGESIYKLQAENWSKTSEKVYLRQDVNLLFKNGFLVHKTYPWKQEADWMADRFSIPLRKDNSIYSLLSFHHAEIHTDDLITCKQAVTLDTMYVTYFQDMLEFFKEPNNARHKDFKDRMNKKYYSQRMELLDKGIRDLNINRDNYEIYNLDKFSLEGFESKVINKEHWERVLGGLWEGIYKNYIHHFNDNDLENYSPPMPWVMVDVNGTHLLVLYQEMNGNFEKLLLQL